MLNLEKTKATFRKVLWEEEKDREAKRCLFVLQCKFLLKNPQKHYRTHRVNAEIRFVPIFKLQKIFKENSAIKNLCFLLL